MGKGKRLKSPGPISTPRFQIPSTAINYDREKPSFSLKDMLYERCGCISLCNKEEKSSILSTLLKLSQRTWVEIKNSARENFGFEKIPKREFRIPLPQSITSEEDLIVFRYSDKGRIAGYRIRDTLNIVAVGAQLYKHD